VPDAREIGDSLVARNIRLQLGTMVCDPSDPMGKMFFNILATFAEFEVDLLRMRTREGMAIARAKGKLKGRAPKLSARLGWVGPGRPAGIAPGGSPRPARRTRRACLHAPGAPRVVPVGQPLLVAAAGLGVHGVGILFPR
jgi:hypothetical protein